MHDAVLPEVGKSFCRKVAHFENLVAFWRFELLVTLHSVQINKYFYLWKIDELVQNQGEIMAMVSPNQKDGDYRRVKYDLPLENRQTEEKNIV